MFTILKCLAIVHCTSHTGGPLQSSLVTKGVDTAVAALLLTGRSRYILADFCRSTLTVVGAD